MDLDLRKLRYFAAVAEELHFGRAADRLHIAQPVLSRQIREFERELDATLFTRANKRVTLTEAGRQLRDDAGPLLAFSQATQRRVRRAHAAPQSLTIGFTAGVRLAPVLEALEARHPGVRIELRQSPWTEQAETLLDGTFDLAFVRGPVEEKGLVLVPFATEPRVVLLSSRHPLARAKRVSIEQLADDPVIVPRDAPADAAAFLTIDPRPNGTRPKRGPIAQTMEEKLEHIAAGRAVAFVPAPIVAMYRHTGIAAVPVVDIPPTVVRIARRDGAASPLALEFIELATAIRDESARAPDAATGTDAKVISVARWGKRRRA